MNHFYSIIKNSLLSRRLSILFLSLLLASGAWGQVSTLYRQDFEVTPGTPTWAFTVSNTGSPGAASGYSTGTSGNSSTDRPALSPLYSEGARGYRMQGPSSGSAATTRTLTFSSVDVSLYTNISLSFRVAGMSLGSTGNGIDASIDEVSIEISTDGGSTYYKQAIVNSTIANAYWGFSGTKTGTRDYQEDNSFSTFSTTSSSTAADQLTTAIITSIPNSANLRLRISMTTNASSEAWIIDDIQLKGEPGCSTPADPTGSISGASTGCGSTILTYGGTVTNAFWQTSATGTATDNPVAANGERSVTASGTYYVRRKSATGNCWSTNSTTGLNVTIYNSPVISANPSNRNIVATTNTSFTVTNTGNAQSFTWQVDNGGGWANITDNAVYSNSNTATLTLTAVPLSYNGYKYRAIANGYAPCGNSAPSTEATLTVTDPSIQAVTTNAATAIVNTTATFNGQVTQLAVSPASATRGFVYSVTSLNNNPQVGDGTATSVTVSGINTSAYTHNATSLLPSTNYTVKAFVFNGTYAYGASQTFTTLAAASHIAFNPAPPSSGSVGQNLTSFSVRALRPDNSVDVEYTGPVTISKASGPGNILGTLTTNAVAGIATFSNIQFDAAGTYTIGAASGGFTNLTSGSIVLTLQNNNLIEFAGASGCTSGSSGTWQTPANWCGGSIPQANDVALFTGKGTNAVIGFNMNGPAAGTTTIAGIYINSAASTDKRIWNSSTTVAGSITVKGAIIDGMANVVINNSGAATFEIANGSARTLGLVLDNTTNNNIVINGSGNLLISTFIAGAVPLTKIGTGTGVLELSGANTYTGLTTVTEGTLQLNRTGGTTLPVTNSVLINGGKLLVSTNQTLSNLTLTSGQLEIASGVTLTINGDFRYVAGTITGAGSLVYGNSSKLVYENTASHTIANEWNASTKEVDLNTNSDLLAAGNLVATKLSFTSGKLTLGANNLTVDQVQGGSETSFIITNGTGTLTVKNVGTTAVKFPVGISASSYSPALISNSNTNDFTVKVRTMTDIYGSNPSWSYTNFLNKVWDITPSGTGASANITLYWDVDNVATEEGENFRENTEMLRKVMIHYTGTNWEEYVASTYTSAAGLNSVSFGAITAFSPFGAALEGTNLSVLPVNIKSFAGNKLSQSNVLNWELATETNINKYIVERSFNGIQYAVIGTVNYNASNAGKYSFEDAGVNSIAYYRLRIQNNDGTFSYSKIIMLNRAEVSKLTLTPNPVMNNVFVTFGKLNAKAQLFVTTLNGSIVKQVALAENSVQATIDATALPAGTYIITIKEGNTVQTKKFIKL